MNKKTFIQRFLSSLTLLSLIFILNYSETYIFNFFLLICLSISIYEWLQFKIKFTFIFLGLIYLITSFFIIYIFKNSNTEISNIFFILTIFICIASDIGGYIFGNIFKGPKLTKISPNKTYAGVIGAFITSILIGYIYLYFLNNELYLDKNFLFFFIIISLSSQIGDIIISYFKRLSKLKDTGNLIPGHGGLLDRIDGMILALPLTFLIIV